MRHHHHAFSHGANRPSTIPDPCPRFSATCCRRRCRRSFMVQATNSRSIFSPRITSPLSSSPSVCPRCVLQRLSSSLEQQLGVAKVRRNPIDVSFHPISQYFVPFLPPRHPSPNAKHARAALQGPPCVSLARDVLECWGLNASQKVKRLRSVISAAIIFEVVGVQVTVRVIAAPLPILRRGHRAWWRARVERCDAR